MTQNSLPLCTRPIYNLDYYKKNKKFFRERFKKFLVLLIGIVIATAIYILLFKP